MILAKTQIEAEKAAKLVGIEYGEQFEKQVSFDIQTSIKNGSYHDSVLKEIVFGDSETAFTQWYLLFLKKILFLFYFFFFNVVKILLKVLPQWEHKLIFTWKNKTLMQFQMMDLPLKSTQVCNHQI